MAQTNAVLLEIPMDIHIQVKALTDRDRLVNKDVTIKSKYLELIKIALNGK